MTVQSVASLIVFGLLIAMVLLLGRRLGKEESKQDKGFPATVESFAKENDLYNFTLNLVKGGDVEKLADTNYTVRKAAMANPLQKEVAAAKVLEEYGYTVYFTPENIKTSNYDAIIDGRLGEFKKAESYKKIIRRLNEADAQRAATVCLETPTEGHTLDETIKKIKAWFTSGQKPINYVDTVLLIWEGAVIPVNK